VLTSTKLLHNPPTDTSVGKKNIIGENRHQWGKRTSLGKTDISAKIIEDDERFSWAVIVPEELRDSLAYPDMSLFRF
jgi:hypothetical protein